MAKLTDELLETYIRGELSFDESRIIADSARYDHELRARLRRLRSQDAAPKSVKNRREPLAKPDSLVIFVAGDAPGEPAPGREPGEAPPEGANDHNAPTAAALPSAHTVNFDRPAQIVRSWAVPWLQFGLVSTFALFIGLIGGAGLAKLQTALTPAIPAPDSQAVASASRLFVESGGLIAATGDLARTLESVADEATPKLGPDTNYIRPSMTFKSHGQQFCREYELFQNQENFAGIACRSQTGQWQVRLHVSLGRTDTARRIRLASPGEIELVDMVTEQLRLSPPIGPQGVGELVATRWSDGN